jgi:alkylation response protein AidB-like acyl-CoA dehydrogenase
MRFGFTERQDEFRARVRADLASDAVRTALAGCAPQPGTEPDVRPLYRVLGDLGLLAVHWPVEYGGRGMALTDAAIVAEELVRAGVPDTLHVNTIQIVGQFLLMAGSDEQRRRLLPGLVRGERFASVLYTEPGAGSDLGALRAVAEPDGEGYRITGTKVFSLKTRFVDLGLCAARTDPDAGKYQGISLFLLDMGAPGVSVRVIPGVSDEQFHRVELDGVAVRREDLLGRPGEGWPLLHKALAIERTGLDYHVRAEHWLDAALDCLLDADPDLDPDDDHDLARAPHHLEHIGRFGALLDAGHVLCWQVLSGIAADRVDAVAAAAAKHHSSELAAAVAAWGATLPTPAQRARALPAARILDSARREAPGLTLSAGTSEVMLQIVASGLHSAAQEGH